MRGVLQRVKNASVTIDGNMVSSIENGILILIGVTDSDTESDADYIAEKTVNARIFEDNEGKMNLSLLDVGGEVLAVSQFTLYGDARKGRRPGYSGGAAPEIATELFDKLCAKAKTMGIKKVATGVFQADMKVALVNDGPVTLLLDSEKLF